MTTGSISYSPDYKSIEDRPPLNVIFEQGMERQRLNAERARLEREVIEAAKKWYTQAVEHNFDLYPEEQAIAESVQALIDFESQIKK